MKIIFKYILTNIKERKIRTAVMLLSILLSTVLLFVSFSMGTSYESAQRKMARGMAGSATISVKGTESLKALKGEDIPSLKEIGNMAGVVESTAVYHDNGYYESLDLIGADLRDLSKINKPRLVNGGEITDFKGNQIILPDRFTSKYGIEKGDSITLQIGGALRTFEVAEISAYDTVFLRKTRGATAMVSLETMFEITGQQDSYSQILIEPGKGITTDELKSALLKVLPGSEYQVSETVDENAITADARQKSMPFFLISFFALTMSVFIIYSNYKIITLDRIPIIGTFRSIGATEKTVTRILLMESMVYGVAGGLVGIPAGIGVLKIILQGMGKNLTQGIEIPVVISPLSVIFSLAVAIVVSVLSAWLPVKNASKLPIKDVVLGIVEEEHISNKTIVGAGAVIFIISLILPRIVSGKILYLMGGISLLGLIASTILVIPLITNLFSKVFERIYGVIFNNEGRLAARNMRDNKNITQNITMLFISISAVIAISVVGNFVTTYVTDVFKGAEMDGFADGQIDGAFVDKVKAMDGIEKVLPIYVLDSGVQGNGNIFSRMEAADNLDLYSSMMGIHYTKGSLVDKDTSLFGKERTIILSEDAMKNLGVTENDMISLSGKGKEFNYRIVGSFKSRATDVEAVIPAIYAEEDFGESTYRFLAYTAENPDAVMIQIRNLFGENQNWSRTVEEFNSDALTTVGAFLKPMHSMTYFILLLATLGVINNLLINYIQKRHTIAMYKSVGLSNRQNMRMTLIEGFSAGLIGAVIATFVSYMEIQTIFLVAGPKISMKPDLDITTFLVAGAMGIVITLMGSVVPIIKSRKMKVVEEIKFE